MAGLRRRLAARAWGPETYDRWWLVEVQGGFAVYYQWSRVGRFGTDPDRGGQAMAAELLIEDRPPGSAVARRALRRLIEAGALRKPD